MLATSDDDLTVLILDNNEAGALADLLRWLTCSGGAAVVQMSSNQLGVLADLAETMGV
tara:strand:+ start:58 stop:231 length:174 start_codon:yes stop_codon:yes gene_type:complete